MNLKVKILSVMLALAVMPVPTPGAVAVSYAAQSVSSSALSDFAIDRENGQISWSGSGGAEIYRLTDKNSFTLVATVSGNTYNYAEPGIYVIKSVADRESVKKKERLYATFGNEYSIAAAGIKKTKNSLSCSITVTNKTNNYIHGVVKAEVLKEDESVNTYHYQTCMMKGGAKDTFKLSLPLNDGAVTLRLYATDSKESGNVISGDVLEYDLMPTMEQAQEAIADLQDRVTELKSLIAQCNEKGISTDYETTHCNILEDFVGYLQDDLSKNIRKRVDYTMNAAEKIYNEDKAALKAYISGRKKPREVPKFMQGDVKFNDVSFLANAEMPDGTMEERPTFFMGYGHNLDAGTIQNMRAIGADTTQFGVGLKEVMSTIPYWTITSTGKPQGEYSYDSKTVKEGNRSFKMVYTGEEKNNTFYAMTQVVKTIPGHRYTLKGWVKAENSKSTIAIYANNWRNANYSSGTFDWKEISINASAVGETMVVRFVFQGPADGIWLDNFRFYDTADTQTNLLRNGDFEQGDGETPVYDSESKVMQDTISNLKAARENGVYVDFALGTQDFPEDIIKKNDIAMADCVFFKYNINAPVAKKIVEEYVRKTLNIMKDYEDVIHSICLTNEPTFQSRNCGDFYNEQWWQFLRERYNNNISELNTSYGTSFSDFTQIDQNANQSQPAKNYDYFLFNSQIFADWHKWLADLVHEVCPDIPVYTKMYAYVLKQPSNMLRFNVDAEKFSEIFDINGCDAYDFMGQHDALEKEMWYDFLKSLKNTPIIDSENHNVPDLDTGWDNEDIAVHMGRDIYLGAVHGRGNAINWILSRNVAGQAPFRLGGMVEMADAGYDLNRLAYEITALQNAPKEAAVLYTSSSTLNNNSSLQSIYQAYKAIAMNGKIPRFVVESQLEKMDNYKILIVPNLPYAQPKTLEKISEYIKNGGKVIILGQNTLSKTDKNLNADAQVRNYIFDNSIVLDWQSNYSSTPDKYVSALNDAYCNVLKETGLMYAEMIDVRTGKRAENIEWLIGTYNGKLIVNVANMRNKKGADAKLKLIVNGKEVEKLYDLRKEKEVRGEFTIGAYEVTTYSVDIARADSESEQ